MFIACIVPVIIGGICIAIGITNIKGDISALHSYHRHRVREEDKLPFGKLVGSGMITVGASIAVEGIGLLLAELCENPLFTTIGGAVMGAGLVIGIGICLYAIKKYNHGIF